MWSQGPERPALIAQIRTDVKAPPRRARGCRTFGPAAYADLFADDFNEMMRQTKTRRR